MLEQIIQILERYEDPRQMCAGSVVIPHSSFEDLSKSLEALSPRNLPFADILVEESHKFTLCGGNSSDRFGVLRKSSNTGWLNTAKRLEEFM